MKKGEKSEKSEKSAITYLLNYAGLIMLPSNLIAPPFDAEGGPNDNYWSIRIRKVKKGEKSEKSKITYLVSHLELPILPVPLESPPVMQEVMGMPIIGLLEKER